MKLAARSQAAWVSAVVALLGAAAAGAWFGTSPTAHIPVPPSTATPEQVVRAYLAASTAHDVQTMNALTTGNRIPRQSRFETTWTVRDVRTSPPVPDTMVADAADYRQVVRVDVVVHTVAGHDLNFPDNSTKYWGYFLGRDRAMDPWRIVDQGMG